VFGVWAFGAQEAWTKGGGKAWAKHQSSRFQISKSKMAAAQPARSSIIIAARVEGEQSISRGIIVVEVAVQAMVLLASSVHSFP
jgi:hypothetical protein